MMTWNRSKLKNSDHVPLYDRVYISALGPGGDSGDKLRACIAGFRIRGGGSSMLLYKVIWHLRPNKVL